MMVALGTSIPTSMTVVATSTWTSPARNRRMTVVALLGLEPAVHQADAGARASARPALCAMVVAARRSARSDSSITGSTT